MVKLMKYEPDFEYELVRSDRTTVSIEVTKDARVVVRAPRRMPSHDIERFLYERSSWVEEHLERARCRDSKYDFDRYTEVEIAELKRMAKKIIPDLVERYKEAVGVEPVCVRINRAKGRFGSCSAKNTLNFSCFLMLYPAEAIEYVVVHELCHIKEHNHSVRFYREIERVMPDYKERMLLLRNAGSRG